MKELLILLGFILLFSGVFAQGSNNSTNSIFATVKIVQALPTLLTITGFTANGITMPGDLTSGFILYTDNSPSTEYNIQFLTGSVANEDLMSSYFPLTLVSSTVSATDLKAYYDSSGIPNPYLTYLKGAVDGTEPFAYIKGDGTTSILLIDGARHNFGSSNEIGMAVPGNYPLGTYVVSGEIKALDESSGTVTLTLIIAGTCDLSVPQTSISFDSVDPTSISNDVTTTVSNTGTVATSSLTISGIDWSDGSGHTMPVGQTHWSLTPFTYGTGDNTLTISNATLGTNIASKGTQSIHFQLKIPGGQFPATYTQQITFTSGC
jgi:hypothetical protein